MKFFIGLLIGIGIAGGVAFYLNTAKTPFVDKNFNANANNNVTDKGQNSSGTLILAPGTKMQYTAPGQTQAQAQNKNNSSKPINYDFYDVLQGKKDLNDKPIAASSPEKADAVYFVQVGAFSNPDLANDLKARLALLGYDSKIKTRQGDNATINKVIIGPLDSLDKAKSLSEDLKQQNIASTIIN